MAAEPALPPLAPVEVAPQEPTSVAEPTSIAPTNWRVLGPFSNPASKDGKGRQGMARDFLASLGGEARAVVGAQTSVEHDGKRLSAQAGHSDESGVLDLIPLYQPNTDMKLAYAYAELSLEQPQRALALFGSDDSAVVWVNGKEVHRLMRDRALNPDDDRFEIPLQKGQNRILVKVDNGQGGWGFALRLYDEAAKKQLQAFQLRRHLESVQVLPDSETFLLKATFPELSLMHPRGAETVLDKVRVRWFDPALSEVTEPGREGRYIALVEARTKDGGRYQRMVTFAKVPEEYPLPWVPYEPYGLPPTIELPWQKMFSRAEHEELSRHMWRATQDYSWQKEGGAILTLALREIDPKLPKNASRPWTESGLIQDTQRKLDLRMKLEGRKRQTLNRPLILKELAPQLKLGTETQAGMKPGSALRLRALAREWSKADENGFVVLVARQGVVFMHEAFNGFEKDSLFHPASIAKTLAGLTFGRAVDQGLVGFDQPLSTVLAEYGAGKTRDITFRHCFYHLTGLTNHYSHGGLLNPFLDQDLLIQDLWFVDPGTKFHYNGDGLNLASTALELLTGRTMFELLHEHVEKPFDEPVVQLDSASGTRFSAMYLAKVGQMFLQDGKYGKYQLFSPGFLQQLMPKNASKYAPNLDDKKLESGIGLSWMTDPEGPREKGVLGPNVIGHGSGSGVFWRVALDHDLVMVVGRDKFAGWQSNEDWGDRFATVVAESILAKK